MPNIDSDTGWASEYVTKLSLFQSLGPGEDYFNTQILLYAHNTFIRVPHFYIYFWVLILLIKRAKLQPAAVGSRSGLKHDGEIKNRDTTVVFHSVKVNYGTAAELKIHSF